ncbi:MAG: valine--tRNA ligase, partial [Dehalococcoidales bacterium]|nr:valine--tRNA ligase [Dehalococcoidales bacterium]
DRYAAREAIISDLDKAGQLVRIEDYGHSVGHCQRCQTVVEPMASLQWYVKIAPLAEPAIAAIKDGSIKILPERFTKVYLNWMENIRDWCISRQLWWGHRIPVWYCRDCHEIIAAVETPAVCSKCGSSNIEQDEDVLDTWFSSGLWPHSTLGWPDETGDFKYFYPTAVMETGYDILFFWVARMIMMGIENTGEIPFHTVYLHGLIRDDKGDKMSKTRGNVVDPLIMMKAYGTDALRFALTTGTSPGADSRLSTEKMEAGRNFANKLWNATRFVLGYIPEGFSYSPEDVTGKTAVEDRWILSRLNRTVQEVTSLMEDFQFGEAERQIHDFLWGEYCDWYIELAKIRMQAGDASPQPVLLHTLETALRLLHPFMPFLTEELWQHVKPFAPHLDTESIMIAPYPATDDKMFDAEAEGEIGMVMEVIRAIRNLRAQYRVESSQRVEAAIYTDESLGKVLSGYAPAIRSLAHAEPVTFHAGEPDEAAVNNAAVEPMARATVVIPMASMVDLAAEKKRLEKDLEQTQNEVNRLETRLYDQTFLTRAPGNIIEKERQKLYTLKDKVEKLLQQYSRL